MKKKTPLTRSQNMARIKSKNTKLEIYIRKLLYKIGYRYRVNCSQLPETPDIFILKYNTAIFVNGGVSGIGIKIVKLQLFLRQILNFGNVKLTKCNGMKSIGKNI